MLPLKTIACCAAALFSAALTHAQGYPNRPITLVVPASAGSITDYTARVLSAKLSERLKQPVLVDNRTGANGQIAMEWLIKQKPDGYTLTVGPSSTHAGNPSLYKNLRYDPVKDFTPIARIGQTALIVSVNNALPVTSLKDLITYSRERPGKVSYAWANSGSLVGAEAIRAQAGLSLIGASYKVSGQALTDLMAGHVDMYVIDFQTAMASIKAGKIRGLAVTSAHASPLFPGVPPVSDTFPGFEVTAWNALFGPAGLPRDVVDRLATEVNEILADKEVQTALLANGITAMPTRSPEELGKYVADQIVLWRRLVQQAGIQPE